jgi:hypothetical protein
MVWRAWRWISTSVANTVTTSDHHWTTLISFGDSSKEQIPISNICKVT